MTTSLNYRRNRAPRGSIEVIVYPVGATLRSLDGNCYVVEPGHSFCINDKVMQIPESGEGVKVISTVQSATATRIEISHDVDGSPGDKLVNLCRDSGDTKPMFDASKMRIYEDRSGKSVIEGSSISISYPDLNYEYYHKGGGRAWEISISRDREILCVHTGFTNTIRKYLPTKPFPARLRLHLSDFGTAGDAITDDRGPILAAFNAISAMPFDLLVAWPDDDYLVDGDREIQLVINASNVTLDFRGARMTGNHRIKFDGDSGIDGDRSAMLSNVHVKNLTTQAINGNKCPKAPRMNWCRDSSMVNIEKNGCTGTAFNLFCCEGVTIQSCSAIRGNDSGTTDLEFCYDSDISNCSNVFGFLIHLCDDTIIEDCLIDGRDYDEDRNYPLWYGLQIKGGNNNIVRDCRCVNLRIGDNCCVNACFRDRGDAPWQASETGTGSSIPTYPYESIGELSGVNLWLHPDNRRASYNTTFINCVVENCDGFAFFVRESINTSFENCSATRDDSLERLGRCNAGIRVRNREGGEESNITISRCSIRNYRTGISIEGASKSSLFPDCTIERSNIVSSTNLGIEFRNTDNCTARDCLVLNTINRHGIHTRGTNITPHVEHCISSDNQEYTTQNKGILIDADTENATINNCICLNNTVMQIEDNGIETELSDNLTSEDQFIALRSNDSTPSVRGASKFKTANTSGTTIRDFENGHESRTITVLINDVNTTIRENGHISLYEHSAIGPEMRLLTFDFTLTDGIWIESRRSWRIP